MSNICTYLPGVSFVGYLDCEKLTPNLAFRCGAEMPVGVLTAITPIRFVGVPTCESTSQYENNGRLWETTLKFSSNDILPLHLHLGFVVKDASGNTFLIGSRERQYPSVKATKSSGSPSGEPAVISYEIKWKSAVCSLIPCSF